MTLPKIFKGKNLKTYKARDHVTDSGYIGNTQYMNAGIIEDSKYRLQRTAIITTSETVGDGTANSAGVTINKDGIYACEASQALAAANVRILVDGSAYFSGTITAAAGSIGGWTITAGNLSSGNININSANERIRIGTQSWAGDGIQLEYNAGNSRFYVGDGSNNYVKFDGTDLSVAGDLDIKDGRNITIEDGGVIKLDTEFYTDLGRIFATEIAEVQTFVIGANFSNVISSIAILTADYTSPGTYATVAVGANISLDCGTDNAEIYMSPNSFVDIAGEVVPGTSDTYDIGSTTVLWNKLWVGGNGATDGIEWKTSNEEFLMYFADDTANANFYLSYAGSGQADIVIDSAGKVGINVSPDKRLHVAGETYSTNTVYIGSTSTDNGFDDATHGAGSTTMYIGNRTIDTSASDERYKDFVEPEGLTDKILQLDVGEYYWKGDKDKRRHIGISAQKAYAVSEAFARKPQDEKTGLWKLEHQDILCACVKKIQELNNRISKLEEA